jgi:hypothetical protein
MSQPPRPLPPRPHDARTLQNPPADALAVLVGRDPHIHLLYRDLASLRHAMALSRYPERTFVVVCRPTGQQIDVRRVGLRLVVAEPNANGIGGVYVYTANRRLPYSLRDEQPDRRGSI